MIAALPAIGSLVTSLALDQVSQAVAPRQGAGAGFGQVFAEVGEMIDRLKSAEATSISAIEGRAPVQEMVESVVAAEQSLHTALAIRDKIVSAYQVLSQMPI